MIEILLFRYGRQYLRREADTASAADQILDLLLTEILQDKHGHAEFQLTADQVSDIGGFAGRHFASGPFVHPAPTRVLKPA